MALTPAQLNALINANIRENNRKAITGKAMNMVLNEMVDAIDSAGQLDSNILTDDLIATGNRNQNLAGYSLRFYNGKFILGNDLSLPYLLQINGAAAGLSGMISVSYGSSAVNGSDLIGRGVIGSTNSGIGVDAVASGSGTAIRAVRSSGLAGQFVGKCLIEPVDSQVNSDSAIFEVNSTQLGSLPVPRMSQAQINALPILTEALLVYNLGRKRYEFHNGSFFQGMSTRFLQVFFTQWNPTSGQTVAFGCVGATPQQASLSPAPHEIVLRGNGVIRGCDFTTFAAGLAGTNQAWSLFIRLNGVDYFVATVSASTAVRTFANSTLNIPFSNGEIARMILVNPAWTQPPTQVGGGGFLTLQ